MRRGRAQGCEVDRIRPMHSKSPSPKPPWPTKFCLEEWAAKHLVACGAPKRKIHCRLPG